MRLSRWGQSPYETDEDMVLERRALEAHVEVCPWGVDAEIVVVHSKVPMGRIEHMRAPSLRLVLTTTSGTDHIDLDHFRNEGVVIARLPEARRDAVVDTTVGALIWGLRRIGVLRQRADEGTWARAELPALAPVGLRGARVGIVGMGIIGSKVAEVLMVMGASVCGIDPSGLPQGVSASSLEWMLAQCDALSLHCDLNPTTHGLLDAETLKQAHRDLVLVNTARGALLDANVAIEMACAGKLGAVALDVFPVEPWGSMDAGVEASNVLLMPHAAGYHRGLARAVRDGLVRAVVAFVDGHAVPHTVQGA